jgi:hypothetical protein
VEHKWGGSPNWDLLKIPDLEKLPAVNWKLQNIEKLKEEKRRELAERLTKTLQ